MNTITQWIKDELYPSLYERIDVALPEHRFNRFTGGWRSKTYLNGSPHKARLDKTVVTRRAPGLILEQGGSCLSLIDYVIQRDGVEFMEAVKSLANIAGLRVPTLPEENPVEYKRQREKMALLEACNGYFTYCLNGDGAEDIRRYLTSRGYATEDITAMELGAVPSQDKLYQYLSERGYSQAIIEEALKLKADTRIGSTHRLSIPYRSGGEIKGFKFRAIADVTPKYINTSGLDRIGGFFNLSGLKGDKDLIIVEGELDSLHATAKGMENVVATGGSSINEAQVNNALQRGAKSFTLCFDTEPGKEAQTATNIDRAINILLGVNTVNRVYIASLPAVGGAKTDPDSYIQSKGIEAFKDVIATAVPYYKYRLYALIGRCDIILREAGKLTDRQQDGVLDEVVAIGAQIKEPLDRDRYTKLAESLKGYGVTEEGLWRAIDKVTSTRDKEAQDRELKKLLSEATQRQTNGDTAGALELLTAKVKDVIMITSQGLLPQPMDYATILEEISTVTPALKTGYRDLDTFVGFTPGAITLIAGRPSHGKTTLLYNLLLQMSTRDQSKNFYFFTYEEPARNLFIKLLNRLIETDLSGHYASLTDLARQTNYEFIKAYIKAKRTDIASIEKGKAKLQELIDSQRIKVIDRNYSVEELSSLIAYLNKTEPIGGILIDYIQRMRTERRTQDKRTEIAHISDQVLQIAKENGLPIILGAQLNRATGVRPTLENLKEAGNLEEDANTVLSVYNESRERDESPEGGSYSAQREVELELRALKNREGNVNETATLIFDKWTGVIKNRPYY